MLKKYLVLTLLTVNLITIMTDLASANDKKSLPDNFIAKDHNEELIKIIKTSDSDKIIKIWDEKLANINKLSTKKHLTQKQEIELSALKQELKDITSILFLKHQFPLLNQLLVDTPPAKARRFLFPTSNEVRSASLNGLPDRQELLSKKGIGYLPNGNTKMSNDIVKENITLYHPPEEKLSYGLGDKFQTIEANNTNLLTFREVLERVTLLTTDNAVFLAAFYEEDQVMWELLEQGAKKEQAIKGIKSRKYIDQDLIKKIEDFKNG